MKLKCLIIDDEPDAIVALRIMVSDFSGDRAEVTGTAQSVREGIQLIEQMQPDLVFLDIEMPDGGGFKIAETFRERAFKLVFVTAYDQYAIRALKLKAEDYLLKPVDHEELEKLVYDLWTEKKSAGMPIKVKIPTKHSVLFVDPADIVFIKGDGRYSEIFLSNSKNYVVTKNIGQFESELQSHSFFRTHKSYLVNLHHISSLLSEEAVVLSTGHRATLSRRRRQELKSIFEQLKGL